MEPYVVSRFVEAMLRAAVTQDAIDGIKTGMSESGMNLTHTRFAKIEIPVPPTNEQKRIADKLDAVLARVDACRDRLNLVPAILKRFRQSVVSTAVTGKLTEDWRNQQSTSPDIYRSKSTTLVDLCLAGRVITYGVIKLGNETPQGVPCLRTSNVRWLRFDTEGIKRIASGLSLEYSRTILQGGEVLVNVRGTLGGVAVVSTNMVGWNVSREVAVVPVDATKASPDFLALWIASDSSQRWLSKVEKGVAYVGINIEDLRALPVELPSLQEQTEIVRRVESLFAYADRLEARYASARAQTERLTPALLAKAFRGELVPQDPNDEPASVLLQRIRASREAAPAKLKSHKGASHLKKTQKSEVIMLNRKDIPDTHLTAILKERGPLSAETLWSASQLDIDNFYDQLKDEEARGLLKEQRGSLPTTQRMLEAA